MPKQTNPAVEFVQKTNSLVQKYTVVLYHLKTHKLSPAERQMILLSLKQLNESIKEVQKEL